MQGGRFLSPKLFASQTENLQIRFAKGAIAFQIVKTVTLKGNLSLDSRWRAIQFLCVVHRVPVIQQTFALGSIYFQVASDSCLFLLQQKNIAKPCGLQQNPTGHFRRKTKAAASPGIHFSKVCFWTEKESRAKMEGILKETRRYWKFYFSPNQLSHRGEWEKNINKMYDLGTQQKSKYLHWHY